MLLQRASALHDAMHASWFVLKFAAKLNALGPGRPRTLQTLGLLTTVTTGVVVAVTTSICVAVGPAVTVMVLGRVSVVVVRWVTVMVAPGAVAVTCGAGRVWVRVEVSVKVLGVTRQLHALEIWEGAKLSRVAGKMLRFWKMVCAGAVAVVVVVVTASGSWAVAVEVTVVVSVVSMEVVVVSSAAVTVMVTASPVTVTVFFVVSDMF